ncbi:Na+/H+ antiporter subunit E [Pseudoroseomonas deserti]|uniref:Na+/H+ antiporter subunit E n=2 Tax=Teichococcus deserti TaxID=1817963 RepID=A0A1V2GX25_9PROT|nr:Na+/H+ antiporter subunit E [Pseudoroseomonas deserti]
MRWILPHPILSTGLLLMWLLLEQTLRPGPLLVGLVVAFFGGHALGLLQPERMRIRRPGLILRLAGRVLVDVARSNLAVALVVLKPRPERHAGFIRVPLALRDPNALAALACIMTATPGTAWVEFDLEDGELLLHVLDLVDEGEWLRIVKERYEQPLLEIFQ